MTITKASIVKLLEGRVVTRLDIFKAFGKLERRHEDRITMLLDGLIRKKIVKQSPLTLTEIRDGVPVEKQIPGLTVA